MVSARRSNQFSTAQKTVTNLATSLKTKPLSTSHCLPSLLGSTLNTKKPSTAKNPPDTSKAVPFSDFTRSGALGFPEVTQPLFDEINQMYGTDIKPLFTK